MHQKVNVLIFFQYSPKMAVLNEKVSSLIILLSSSSLAREKIHQKIIITTHLYYGFLGLYPRTPILPLHPQNLLERVSE